MYFTKERGIYIIFIILFLVSFIFVDSSVFETSEETDFNEGTYSDVEYNSSGFVQLSSGSLSGTYTSEVLNATFMADWINISWVEGVPYAEELPNNQQVETVISGANMTDCVLLMHFDESSGDIGDYSGQENNGTVSGGNIDYGESGKFDTALGFNKLDGRVSIENSSSTLFTDKLTVEFWIKRKNSGNWEGQQTLVRKGDYDSIINTEWHFVGPAGGLDIIKFRVATAGGNTDLSTSTSFADTNWHHIVGTYNGSDMFLYVDGILDNNVTHSNPGDIKFSNSYNISVGAITAAPWVNPPNAIFDELAIYSRVLNSTEILDHYKRGALNLNVTVRSCFEPHCQADSWNDTFTSVNSNLSVNKNQFFQYKFDFCSDSVLYTPKLYNVTTNYEEFSMPNFTSRELAGRPTNSSITISLITGNDNISGYIEYGNLSEYPSNYTDNTSVQFVENNSLLEFNITGLQPDTQYYYRVRANNTTMDDYSFSSERTFRTRREEFPFNITILSDFHLDVDSPASYLITLRRVMNNVSKNDSSDFIIFLGDNVQAGSDGYGGGMPNRSHGEAAYEALRNAIHPDYNSLPSYFAIGNWEGESGWITEENLSLARDIRMKYIPNPSNTTYDEGGSEYDNYYAFTWGNALFIVLDVMSYTEVDPADTGNSIDDWTLGTDQLNWLNDTLINSDESWKILLIHHVVGGNWSGSANDDLWSRYGRGGGRSAYLGEQATIHQMMIDNDVRILFYAHDHVFTDIVVDKIHYIQTGRSGEGLGFAAGYPGYCIDSSGRIHLEFWSDEIVKVHYTDTDGNQLENLTIDRMEPRLEIVSPDTDYSDTDGNITITFNVTDFSDIQNCTLFLNDNYNQSNTSMIKDENTNFSLYNLTAGNYTWYINCTDYNYNDGSYINYTFHDTQYTPNSNSTISRTFSVIFNSEFGGNTTDLSSVNISNITNLVIDQPNYGIINFTDNINLSDGGDLDTYVNISFNSIYINSTALPSLNKSARLTLINLSYIDPQVLKDDEVCQDCVEISYSGGTFIFDVNSFSTYSARETPSSSSSISSSGSSSGSGTGAVLGDLYNIKEKDKIKFIFASSQNHFDVEDITSEYIDVLFNEKRIRILLGEKESFDVDYDGNYDLILTLEEIISDSEAILRIRKYNQEMDIQIYGADDLISKDDKFGKTIDTVVEIPKKFFINIFSKNLLLSGSVSSIVILLIVLFLINKKFKKRY